MKKQNVFVDIMKKWPTGQRPRGAT